ncbi:hypothetical protein PC116_g24799 [Phytophthora cactorum]|uniref:Uncharacterized protein n=1 Tax=Phytophthora cactorum TaxID=29920 RepID=A0A8T1BA68_9STRA|nr:hypothetical protein PC114_g22945 [Phytophthora cactorum]KAG2897937.1 hypothetical protein PC117_g22693 [Phytophthora cactorum]KAG2970903.1 hypothetical protein PC119_g23529 [Phytophthora cactorum]KAG3123558.1 hypothetical protein C6341_g26511 [Phytophthora cactorum]KAG4226802.1 hypothetical protein PC116_g24799 [Phytophthora cactorum]
MLSLAVAREATAFVFSKRAFTLSLPGEAFAFSREPLQLILS